MIKNCCIAVLMICSLASTWMLNKSNRNMAELNSAMNALAEADAQLKSASKRLQDADQKLQDESGKLLLANSRLYATCIGGGK